jgi:membrane-associated phospholipid phosphatase
LTGNAYTAAFQEVKSLGEIGSSTRTSDQTQIAQFWNPAIWIAWNNIAETAALDHHDTLMQNARLFALLNVSFADSVIAFYDAKYAYHLWRPVTAIRAAETDGNEATAGDPNWTPLAPTAQDPSYPGAHAVISAAGADVLASFFGSDAFRFSAQSTALPGIERSFASFSAASREASLSRIYAGQHFRTDEVAGQRLGGQVADYVLHELLLPTRPNHGS